MRSRGIFLVPLILLISLLFISPAFAGEDEKVLVLEIDDIITPVADDIVQDAITKAETEGFEALVITLDTPGGGLTETFEMIKLIENTDVPVIGYVYPEGANAWSAGTLILISTDIAAMSPFTVIGSAQPVQLSTGGVEPINDTKVVNALVEFATERARKNDRNVTATEEFITKNLNLNSEEALEFGVIEYVADDIDDLLVQVDGETVKGKQIDTDNARLEFYQPPLRLAFMNIISNPVVSSILLLVGIYGIILGISNPGFGAEVFGVIAITLGLIGTGFDVNIGAVFLLLAGVALLVLEVQAPGFGVFGLAGIVCLVAGSILLVPLDFPRYYTPADFQETVILAVVAPTVLLGVLLVFVIYKVFEVRRRRPEVGEIIGDIAEARDPLGPDRKGSVLYKGAYWRARSEDMIEIDEKVEIVEKDGTVLVVKKYEK